MFRRPVKPRSNASQTRIRRRPNDDSDDDDGAGGGGGDPLSMIQKIKTNKKKKTKRTVVTKSSLAHLEYEADTSSSTDPANSNSQASSGTNTLQPQRNKRMTPSLIGTTGAETTTANSAPRNNSSMYGSEALAQLKAEQRYQKRPTAANEDAGGGKAYPNGSTATSGTKLEKQQQHQPTMLTGEEALLFMQQQQQQPLAATTTRDAMNGGSNVYSSATVAETFEQQQMMGGSVVDTPQDDAWEAQVARRAGITQQQQQVRTAPTAPNMGPPGGAAASSSSTAAGDAKKVSLLQLRQQIDTALNQLQAQQIEISRTQERRSQQVHQIEEELQRYERDLRVSGQAHEYFQEWRHRLACWVGALRDLSTKVVPLQDALYDLEAEVAAVSRWKDWEDDMASVLQEHDCLERVLGRQPAPNVLDTLRTGMVVDEFGRSAQSQYALQREKRFRHRQRIHEQRNSSPPRGDESDAYLSDGEQEDFRERHVALQNALDVALNELDEEYTKLQGIVDDFEQMRTSYPDEYKQCFSGLSLADLASVLIRMELCSLNDPWNESHGYNEGKWTAVIRAAKEKGLLDDAALERLIEKTVLLAVNSLTQKNGINLSSKRQMESMGNFILHVQNFLQPDSKVMERLRLKLSTYVQKSLDDIAVPIAKQTALVSDTDALTEALQSATVGQMHRLQKILTNLLLYWAPTLHSDLTFSDSVLDFISSKFIFLLSSLQGFDQPRFSASPGDAFRVVYDALMKTEWLSRPENMLSVAPIRAAANVYVPPAPAGRPVLSADPAYDSL